MIRRSPREPGRRRLARRKAVDFGRSNGLLDRSARALSFANVGCQAEAAAAVPDRLVDAVALVGPPDRIRDRLQVWKAAGQRGSVGTMILMKTNTAGLRVVAENLL